nr:hypothetical protein [Solirubrobacterales bacterium]
MSIKRAICAVASIGALLAVAGAAPAAAASVAYVDQGSVILSSLDGAQKVVLAGPVTNAAGETEPYLAVAQADNGRILAVRNFPGRISRFSSYRVWEPDGSSTVQGPLTAPSGFTIYVYPLSLDLTADGTFVTYGFSNSSGCCPIQLREGTYARSADGNSLDPIELSGHTWPTTFGRRLITASGSTIEVQNADAAPFGTAFTPWLDLSGLMLDLSRTDVAANGKLAAFEVTRRDSGSQTVGKIGVVGIESPGGALTGTPDCFLPATGLAGEASLSQDATRIAWRDQDGLKVAGSPVTIADPCALTSPPVVLSATGRHPSIGGADIARFLPPAPPAPP